MGIRLLFVATWSFVLSATSLFIALNSKNFYLFTLPFIVASALIVLLACIAGFSGRLAKHLYWITVSIHGLLFIPFFFALNRWPGGDDGPGLAWLLLIGSGSFIAFVMVLVFLAKGTATID